MKLTKSEARAVIGALRREIREKYARISAIKAETFNHGGKVSREPKIANAILRVMEANGGAMRVRDIHLALQEEDSGISYASMAATLKTGDGKRFVRVSRGVWSAFTKAETGPTEATEESAVRSWNRRAAAEDNAGEYGGVSR